jgi:hypothetical protein
MKKNVQIRNISANKCCAGISFLIYPRARAHIKDSRFFPPIKLGSEYVFSVGYISFKKID